MVLQSSSIEFLIDLLFISSFSKKFYENILKYVSVYHFKGKLLKVITKHSNSFPYAYIYLKL